MITKLPFSLKYETGLDYPITMYDHLPYQWDSDYCNAEKIGLSTGKIIKYYLCNNETEPLTINNHDDEIDELLLHIQLQEQKHAQITKEPQPETQQVSDEITQDQIESLLADNTEEPDADPKPITDFEPAEETIEPEIESSVVS